MSKYKKYTIKLILFIFIMEKFINILNYVYYNLNIDIGSLMDFMSIGILAIIGVPLTLLIIDFLFKE